MAYSDFKTIKDVKAKFPITVSSAQSFFAEVEKIQPSRLLRENLAENIPVALNINTEKARSELIITPILIEVRKLFGKRSLPLLAEPVEANGPLRQAQGAERLHYLIDK